MRLRYDQNQFIVDDGREDYLRHVNRVRGDKQVNLEAEERGDAIKAECGPHIEVDIRPRSKIVWGPRRSRK